MLPVSQRIPAGAPARRWRRGSAARIFTGAPIPPGADAVVMQEDTEAAGEQAVRILRVPAAGPVDPPQRRRRHPRRGGAGDAASACPPRRWVWRRASAWTGLPVARRPRVALFSTGDELVMPGDVPPEQMKPGAIYNSNRFFLSALLRRLGCEVTDFGIVPDRREATVAALGKASHGP